MTPEPSQQRSEWFGNPIRTPILVNFGLLIVFLSPIGRSRGVYEWIKQTGLESLITTVVQLWVLGATAFATAIFVRRRAEKLEVLTLDGILLAAWWLALIFVCAFAFMIGMGVTGRKQARFPYQTLTVALAFFKSLSDYDLKYASSFDHKINGEQHEMDLARQNVPVACGGDIQGIEVWRGA